MNTANLNQQHCVPCEGKVKPLARGDAEAILAFTPDWVLSGDATIISRSFVFKDFKEAMIFANKVAALAEAEGHHPDITIVWNKVTLHLSTHAIKGLSTNDFVIAAKVNDIFDLS